MYDLFFQYEDAKIFIATLSYSECIDYAKEDMKRICDFNELKYCDKQIEEKFKCWDREFIMIFKVDKYGWSIAKYNSIV